jgi:hypothetical protein
MTNVNQAKTDVKLKELAETVGRTHRECEEPTSADMKAYQVTMEAFLKCKEPASVEMKPEVADEEVPREGATRMPVGEPRKRRWERQNLAAQHRQKKEQERTQSKNGCRNMYLTI